MRSISTILLSIASVFISTAQIAINTENPQSLFHIDARHTTATTNPNTGAPTLSQQQDDVVITKEGRLGIGTIAPTTKLDVNTQNRAGVYPLQITDTTDPTGKVLMSDDNGNVSWVKVQPPIGKVYYPIREVPKSTFTAGNEVLVPNTKFDVPRDGFFSFEVRWWSSYSAAYATSKQIAIELILKLNGTTNMDSFRYQIPFITDESITCYVPLYAKAKQGDYLELYIHSKEGPGDVVTRVDHKWVKPHVLIKELQVKF